MMYAGKFFLLAFLSLVLYSCYINLVYVNINQEAIKRYLYDPSDQYIQNTSCIRVTDRAELEAACADRMSIRHKSICSPLERTLLTDTVPSGRRLSWLRLHRILSIQELCRRACKS